MTSPAHTPLETVREARLEDLEDLVEFNLAMARETEDKELDRGRLMSGVRAVLEDPGRGRYLVLPGSTDGPQVERILGALMVTREWSDWRGGWFWWIQSVYTRPQARGRGVYRALQDRVFQEARTQGDVCGVRLYVESENKPARSVYEHLGMEETAYRLYEVDFGKGG